MLTRVSSIPIDKIPGYRYERKYLLTRNVYLVKSAYDNLREKKSIQI